jgi:hypothetical protein
LVTGFIYVGVLHIKMQGSILGLQYRHCIFLSLTGAYIKPKDASWAPAIESFLGRFLRSYCVDSVRDAAVLTQIFSEVLGKEMKPVINTSKFFDKVGSCTYVKN